MKQCPRVGIALLIRKDNKILLGYRTGNHASGMWGCPGGHLEMWESFERAAIRETYEECGLKISKTQLLTVENTLFPEEGKQYVVVFLIADYEGGDIINREPDKCDGWIWFSREDFKSIPMMPGLQQLLDRGIDPFAPLV